MKLSRLTTCALAACLAVVFSGLAQSVHALHDHHPAGDHHGVHGVADACAAGQTDLPADSRPAPLPDDREPDDCSTCYHLLHLLATGLDLAPTRIPPAHADRADRLSDPLVLAVEDLGLTPGRGPPMLTR